MCPRSLINVDAIPRPSLDRPVRRTSGSSWAIAHALAVLLIVIAIVNGHATAAQIDRPVDRPNIVLVMADDLGYGDVGFLGGEAIATPHLDRLAADGITWRRFYAGSPVCSPSRAMVLTGRHAHRLGITGANAGHMPGAEITLAEALRDRGYRTGHFGKWHLGTLTTQRPDSNRGGPTPRGRSHFAPPREHGFDVNVSTEAKVPTWDPYFEPLNNRNRSWWDPLGPNDRRQAYGTAYWSRGQYVPGLLEGDDSRIILDFALPFIRDTVAEQRPFLAVVWFHSPHRPVVSGDRDRAPYDDGRTSHAQHYAGTVAALDAQIGRLRDELRRLGVVDETLIWFWSDNGPEGFSKVKPGSPGPFRGRKATLYEGGIRVPCALVWPEMVRPGRVINEPAAGVDVLPTLLELLGDEPIDDRTYDGRSLAGWLVDQPTPRDEPLGFLYRNRGAWVLRRHKLIVEGLANDIVTADLADAQPSDLEVELYDLRDDPAESRNLNNERPVLRDRLLRAFLDWRAEVLRDAQSIEEPS